MCPDALSERQITSLIARFAARSKTFSVDMCPKLLEMITGQATSLPIKLRLIPIFQHMHHDAATAAQVRQREGERDIGQQRERVTGISILTCLQVRAACLSMLPSYPGQSFLLTTLRTLTSLATHTLVDVPDQVCWPVQF